MTGDLSLSMQRIVRKFPREEIDAPKLALLNRMNKGNCSLAKASLWEGTTERASENSALRNPLPRPHRQSNGKLRFAPLPAVSTLRGKSSAKAKGNTTTPRPMASVRADAKFKRSKKMEICIFQQRRSSLARVNVRKFERRKICICRLTGVPAGQSAKAAGNSKV
uniref:Uncharacterized protein n=1 Tax=Trichuris muris TaxID=70415 RepID=A0A5S6QP71_TRIMR